MSGKSRRETNESRISMCSATPDMKRGSRKKATYTSLKKLFRFGRSTMTSSSSKQSSCAWTVIDSMGTISLSEGQEDEGYGNYEEYKRYSFSDFGSDELCTPHHCEKLAHPDESTLRCRDARSTTDHGVGIVENVINPTEPQKILTIKRKEILEAKSLTAKGKIYYSHKLYQDALSLQLQALDLIQSIMCDQQCIDARLLLQEATVEYELSKSKYALLKECSTLDENEGKCRKRNIAYNKVQIGKFNLLNKSVIYYQDELLHLDSVDINNFLDLDKVGYKLYILHSLGKIHSKKLAQYSHALNYYNKALDLEVEVLSVLEARNENLSTNRKHELKKWNMTIQTTRKKIGSIHYLTGRLDLAVEQTFTPNEISLRRIRKDKNK